MPDALETLIERIDDSALRTAIRGQVAQLRAKRSFGLVFESHLPERVQLSDHPLRPGVVVSFRDGKTRDSFEVLEISGTNATIAAVRSDEMEAADAIEVAVDDLVVVADFGQPIFPGLRQVGSAGTASSKPAHVVINGENHHVLESLQFTHLGRIDCIYIDPPYNSGASDWKYDNDYVDRDDAYRHSKWLAFMERRLNLAKSLLNPDDSVLIVTIDEKEYLRLGLLLEQIFVDARIQMVSIAINPAGVARKGSFSRSDEYAFFVAIGDAAPQALVLPEEWVSSKGRTFRGEVRWDMLRRSGTNAERRDRPQLFYPIYINPNGPTFHSVGEFLPGDERIAPTVEGAIAVLPIRKDGSEGNWQVSPSELRNRINQGRVRIGGSEANGYVIYQLKKAEYQKVLDGIYPVTGRSVEGALLLEGSDAGVVTLPASQWRITAHDSTQYGSRLLATMLPGRKFPFPKSLYAVEDCLRFFLHHKPNAVVLDFFAGSGTTTHAVMRLNREDGGERQSIVVTNNAVSPDEDRSLKTRGLRPGDEDYEAIGIFNFITRPRIEAAISGTQPDGTPIPGEYRFGDQFSISDGLDATANFFDFVYLDPEDVELDLAFEAIAPLLWLRAGGVGPVIQKSLDAASRHRPYAWTDHYGVLFNPDRWRSFVTKAPSTARAAFVVTDSQATFSGIAHELPEHLDVVRLYENYLTTFAINEGRH